MDKKTQDQQNFTIKRNQNNAGKTTEPPRKSKNPNRGGAQKDKIYQLDDGSEFTVGGNLKTQKIIDEHFSKKSGLNPLENFMEQAQQAEKGKKGRNNNNKNTDKQNIHNNSNSKTKNGERELQIQRNNNYRKNQENNNNSNNQNKRNKNNNNLRDNQNNNNNNRNGKKQRKPNNNQQQIKYMNYYTQEQVQQGLANKTLFRGMFIANEKTRRIAAIKPEGSEDQLRVRMLNQESQNRALHKCTVIYKLMSQEEYIQQEQRVNFEFQQRQSQKKSENNLMANNPQVGRQNQTNVFEQLQRPTQRLDESDKKEEDNINEEDEQLEEIQVQLEQKKSSQVNQFQKSLEQEANRIEDADDEENEENEENQESQKQKINKRSEENNEEEEDDDDEEEEFKEEEDENVEDLQELKPVQKILSKEEIQQNLLEQQKLVEEMEEGVVTDEQFVEKKIAQIVYIENNIYESKEIVGQLVKGPMRQNSRGNQKRGQYYQTYFFKPIDKFLNQFYTSSGNIDEVIEKGKNKLLEKNNENNSDDENQNNQNQVLAEYQLENKYFKGKFHSWEQDMGIPKITVLQEIGNIGEIEVECQALLQENDVYQEDFSEECFNYLKEKFEPFLDEQGEYVISDQEKQKRLDLTDKIITTIDPATARDLDDALSAEKLPNGNYKIGVHIADVGHFVDEKTILDEEARLRTTSVYLPHRVIPMLPRLLCERLCSLNPGVERLAFSCFFEMTPEGEVIENTAEFAKTVIKTAVQFSYDIVQEMIEGKIQSVDQLPEKYKPVEGINAQEMWDSVMKIQELGMKRRTMRKKKIPFQIEREKRRFQMDENNWPVSYTSEVRKEANFVVEEFMLLANQLVGKKLVQTQQNLAVLRCHNFPKQKKIDYFQTLLTSMDSDIVFKTGSISEIRESFELVMNSRTLKQEFKDIISFNMIKILEQAQYFVVQDQPADTWRHFALNFDVYTHFTSPIRRYPDVLVHRLLNLAIQHGDKMKDYVDLKKMVDIMDKCNQCKQASRRISDGTEKIFTCLYLKKNCSYTKAIVKSFGNKSLTIIIPEFSLEKDVQFETIKCIKNKDSIDNNLILQCQLNGQQRQVHLSNFKEIDIKLTATDSFPIDFKISICIRNSESGCLEALE